MKTNIHTVGYIAVLDFNTGQTAIYTNQEVEQNKELHDDVNDAVRDHIEEQLGHRIKDCEYMFGEELNLEVNTQ